jgi:hypothetical protein
MNKALPRITFCFLVLFICACPALWAQEKKNMLRTDDFIIVLGNKLKNNLGKDISSLSLFAASGGQAKPIPFQIDETNPQGDWVLTSIPPALKDANLKPETDDDNGKLDANDQLAFMVKDSGDRMDKTAYPKDVLSVDEITLTDPVSGGKSWVYLCSYATNPPRSDVSYIKYDIAKDQVIAQSYVMGFAAKMPIAPGYVSVMGSPNLIDRMKIRVVAHILAIPYHIDEYQFVSKLSLYKAGPIRVIRRTKNAIKIFKIFQTPSAAVENVYYSNIASVPVRMTVPLNVAGVARMFALRVESTGGADFQNMHGWQFKSNVSPNWVTITGAMDETKKSLNGKGPLDWYCLKGPNRAFMIRITLNRKPDGSIQNIPLSTKLGFIDDDKALDPPEDVPGQSPNVWFMIDGIDKLNKGTLYFFATMYMINDYQDGDEKRYLTILDKPIQVIGD